MAAHTHSFMPSYSKIFTYALTLQICMLMIKVVWPKKKKLYFSFSFSHRFLLSSSTLHIQPFYMFILFRCHFAMAIFYGNNMQSHFNFLCILPRFFYVLLSSYISMAPTPSIVSAQTLCFLFHRLSLFLTYSFNLFPFSLSLFHCRTLSHSVFHFFWLLQLPSSNCGWYSCFLHSQVIFTYYLFAAAKILERFSQHHFKNWHVQHLIVGWHSVIVLILTHNVIFIRK